MQQNAFENEFTREYAPLAIIHQGMAIEFLVKRVKWPLLWLELLAPVCAHLDHESGRNEHRRGHSGTNQPDAALDVSKDRLGVERSKCGRHKPALPVSLTPGESAQLLQGGPRNQSSVRKMYKGHHRAHGCHCSWRKQCRFERSGLDIREKYSGRARRSPSPGRLPPRKPYSSENKSPNEVDSIHEQLCVQIGSTRSRCAAKNITS